MSSHLKTFRFRRIAGLAAVLVFTSCSAPHLTVLDKPFAASKTAKLLTRTDALTPETLATLRAENLLALHQSDADAAIQTLAERYAKTPGSTRRHALAEICADRAGRLATDDQPAEAIGHYLDAAQLTEAAALASAKKGLETQDTLLYALSAAQVSRLLHDENLDLRSSITAKGALRTHRLRLATGSGMMNPTGFDAIVPANWLKPKKMKWTPVKQEGLGAALVGHLKKTPERGAADPIMPESGHAIPLNASFRFSGDNATLALQDLMTDAEATIAGREVPLAADFTAPLTFLYYGGAKSVNKFLATLRPGNYDDSIRLYSLEPFRKDKTPLVIVHGLASTAEGWLPFINNLRANPLVREKYQVIAFNYPTGNAIARNAKDLREALETYRSTYDPDRSNPRMRDMVILGHSMGGVMSNIQIRDSGRQLEDLVFTRPISELGLSSSTEEQARELIMFDSNPDIDRAILIAAPLRGSAFASNRIGQIGASLIRLPFDIVESLVREVKLQDAIRKEMRPAMRMSSNSVNSLRPDNPFLAAYLNLPVRRGVPIHTIIAQTDPTVAKEEGTDGIVAYKSAYLDGVASEKIMLNADHRSVLRDSQCVEEVWRILKLHEAAHRWGR